jgi:FixJ family two-component response regulator
MQPKLPVIMITGFEGVEIEEECREKRAVGFLNKAFSVHKLLSLIEGVCKKTY